MQCRSLWKVVLAAASVAVPTSVARAEHPAAPATEMMVDGTDSLVAFVPASWTDRDPSPGIRDDGNLRPAMSAAPDLAAFRGDAVAPGFYAVAVSATVEPAVMLTNYHPLADSCTDDGFKPYDDGRFAGVSKTWSSCNGTTMQSFQMAVRPRDNRYTLLVEIQAEAGDPALSTILASLNAVPGSDPGRSDGAPAPEAYPLAPATYLAATVAPGSVTATDDTQQVSIAVSPAWTDVDGSTRRNDDMSPRAHLAVAPNLDDFFGTWEAAGLEIFVLPYRPTLDGFVQNWNADDGSCVDDGIHSLAVGDYSGLMQTWSNCDGTSTRFIVAALAAPDQLATLYLQVQLPTADDTALTTALASIEFRRS